MSYKAIIFDYIGTLVNSECYSMANSCRTLYTALVDEGFDVAEEKFLSAYNFAHEKYRKIRYEQFKEINNAVWVSEALSNLGFKVKEDDCSIKVALNVFFDDFIRTLMLRKGAEEVLKQVSTKYKVGLISNFTHAPVIHKSLRKIRIHQYFNAIVISEDFGWRKPSSEIFHYTLNRLKVKPEEAVFIGDSPLEDIKGAKSVGLRTIFTSSQFNTQKNLQESGQEPDYIVDDLVKILDILPIYSK